MNAPNRSHPVIIAHYTSRLRNALVNGGSFFKYAIVVPSTLQGIVLCGCLIWRTASGRRGIWHDQTFRHFTDFDPPIPNSFRVEFRITLASSIRQLCQTFSTVSSTLQVIGNRAIHRVGYPQFRSPSIPPSAALSRPTRGVKWITRSPPIFLAAALTPRIPGRTKH